MKTTTDTNLQDIFDLEIERLAKKSKKGELDIEELKRLETLTRTYRTYNSTKQKDNDSDNAGAPLTTEELLALARQGN
jgi:hypothetical protein